MGRDGWSTLPFFLLLCLEVETYWASQVISGTTRSEIPLQEWLNTCEPSNPIQIIVVFNDVLVLDRNEWILMALFLRGRAMYDHWQHQHHHYHQHTVYYMKFIIRMYIISQYHFVLIFFTFVMTVILMIIIIMLSPAWTQFLF